MEGEGAMMKIAYTLLAAFAGAVTALAFMKWKQMTWPEIVLTIFVGFAFAVFVTPWLARYMFGSNIDVQTLSGLTYITASGSNTLLPMLIRWLRRSFGEHDANEKSEKF